MATAVSPFWDDFTKGFVYGTMAGSPLFTALALVMGWKLLMVIGVGLIAMSWVGYFWQIKPARSGRGDRG